MTRPAVITNPRSALLPSGIPARLKSSFHRTVAVTTDTTSVTPIHSLHLEIRHLLASPRPSLSLLALVLRRGRGTSKHSVCTHTRASRESRVTGVDTRRSRSIREPGTIGGISHVEKGPRSPQRDRCPVLVSARARERHSIPIHTHPSAIPSSESLKDADSDPRAAGEFSQTATSAYNARIMLREWLRI